jgi:hypothetical protein
VPSRNASFHEGEIAAALLAPPKIVFALILYFVGITLVAWIVDWTFVFKVWPDGIDRLRCILAADLARAYDLAARHGEGLNVVQYAGPVAGGSRQVFITGPSTFR